MEPFQLDDDDVVAVDVAKAIGRLLLKDDRVTPLQIRGLGNAIYALERMPIPTSGASCEFGLEYREGDADFKEMAYITIRITEETFEIATGGSTYERQIGSDSYTGAGWTVELDGYKNRDWDALEIEEQFSNFLNLGARITVADESEIDFEDDA